MQRTRGPRGFTSATVLIMTGMLMTLGAGLHTTLLQDTKLRGAVQAANHGFYAAEAGVNHGMGRYKDIFLNFGVPSGSDFDPVTIPLGNRSIQYSLSPVAGYPQSVTMPAGRPFAGVQSTEYRYTASAASFGPLSNEEAAVGTEFIVDYIPLFQFLAFYEGDLEILPGPDMNLHGPIHTNGDLYLNANNTLTVEDLPPVQPTVHVSSTGMVYRGRKDSSACGGTVKIDKLQDNDADGSLDPRTLTCAGEKDDDDLAPWLGSLLRDQENIVLPEPDVLERGSGDFWEKADLRIALDLDNPDGNGHYPIVVLDGNENVDAAKTALLDGFIAANPGRIFYNDVPEAGRDTRNVNCGAPPVNSYCHSGSYNPPFAASGLNMYPCTADESNCVDGGGNCLNGACFNATYVAANGNRRGGFYNNRENAWSYMLNVNAAHLLEWNMAQPPVNQLVDPNDATEGGIVIFLTVLGPNADALPNPRYGTRVFGSEALPFPGGLSDPTGLTVVSDQALYIEGDYNEGDGTNPKQPAAAMADTVNVLSSGWTRSSGCYNDCQSGQNRSTRLAQNTTVNVAFLGGVDMTTVGNYNGGFENYPRFHEKWTGTTLTYRGSFVTLGTPQHASGAWCGTGGSSTSGCNIYNPPGRAWDFDTDFVDVANLPPLTPRFILVQQILFTENFK
jgi:hypothetical protein